MMKYILLIITYMLLFACGRETSNIADQFNHVDQTIWIVDDLDNTINQWSKLGFNEVISLDTANAYFSHSGIDEKVKVAKANLGGANVTWIQPLGSGSVFSEFHNVYGDGAMSLVHRMNSKQELES